MIGYKGELAGSVGAQYASGDQPRNNSRKNIQDLPPFGKHES